MFKQSFSLIQQQSINHNTMSLNKNCQEQPTHTFPDISQKVTQDNLLQQMKTKLNQIIQISKKMGSRISIELPKATHHHHNQDTIKMLKNQVDSGKISVTTILQSMAFQFEQKVESAIYQEDEEVSDSKNILQNNSNSGQQPNVCSNQGQNLENQFSNQKDQSNPEVATKSSRWTPDENMIYIQCLEHYPERFHPKNRRKYKIFKTVSERLGGRRDSAQCRGHHKKMIQQYGTIEQIIRYLKFQISYKTSKLDVQSLISKQNFMEYQQYSSRQQNLSMYYEPESLGMFFPM